MIKISQILLSYILIGLSIQPQVICQNNFSNQPQSNGIHSKSPTSLNFIIPDFQVNEMSGHHYAIQSDSDIASDCEGNFTIVWLDERDYYDNLYFQQYNSEGEPIGINVNVTSDETENNWRNFTSIAMDKDGFFIIAWAERRDNKNYICATRFTKEGELFGERIDLDLEDYGSELNIAIDSIGTFVISWINRDINENINKGISAQRFSYNAEELGNRLDVAEFATNMSISAHYNHGFIVSWTGWFDGWTKLYFQRFANSGERLGLLTSIIDSSFYVANANPSNPAIDIDNEGNFIIVWEDFREPFGQKIFAQRYSSEGTKLGDNFKVSVSNGLSPCVSYFENGDFVIVWTNQVPYGQVENIYFQRYLKSGLKIWINGQLNLSPINTSHNLSSLTTECDGSFTVTWTYQEIIDGNYNVDIFLRSFSTEGLPVNDGILVNDDDAIPTSKSYNSDIAVYDDGSFIIAWVDERNIEEDIYAQRFSKDGEFLGKNIKANADLNCDVYDPKVAVNKKGISLIVWNTYNPPDSGIIGQLFTSEGKLIGNNISIADNVFENFNSYDILADHADNFIIVWIDKPDSALEHVKLFSRRITENGEFINGVSKIDSSLDNINEWSPSISNLGNNYIVTWLGWNGDSLNASIYSQIFSSNGEKMGDRILIQKNNINSYSVDPSAADNFDGTFSVGWTNVDNFVQTYIIQKFSTDGNKIGPQQIIKDVYDDNYNWIHSRILSDTKGNYLITSYSDRNSSASINQAIRYDSNFLMVGDKFEIAYTNNHNSNDFKTVLHENKIYSTWTNTIHPWNNENIMANVLDWNNPVSVENSKLIHIPNTFALNQNYPNPFNPTTTIKYQIPVQDRNDNSSGLTSIRLNVFDILGREVTTLVNEKQKPGYYEVVWNATVQPSGVYFYQLTAGDFRETRKMILLR